MGIRDMRDMRARVNERALETSAGALDIVEAVSGGSPMAMTRADGDHSTPGAATKSVAPTGAWRTPRRRA